MKTLFAALALSLLATPALAQMVNGPVATLVPPRPGDMPLRPNAPGLHERAMGWRHGGPLAALSLEGRRTMQDAFHGAMVANRPDQDRVAAARDRVVELMGAERLDAGGLKRAMDDERDAAQAMKGRQQAALLGALQRLSPADRLAFAESSRNLRGRFERRGRKDLPIM